jgi:hypothetical protein
MDNQMHTTLIRKDYINRGMVKLVMVIKETGERSWVGPVHDTSYIVAFEKDGGGVLSNYAIIKTESKATCVYEQILAVMATSVLLDKPLGRAEIEVILQTANEHRKEETKQ